MWIFNLREKVSVLNPHIVQGPLVYSLKLSCFYDILSQVTIYSPLHLLNKYLLKICYMPSTVVGTERTKRKERKQKDFSSSLICVL